MKQTLVRYKAKPEMANKNERLIADVFRELHATSPEGLRYVALRLDDGTFVHFAARDDGASPITTLDAFRSFQEEIDERCDELPQVRTATIVGNYRMLEERTT